MNKSHRTIVGGRFLSVGLILAYVAVHRSNRSGPDIQAQTIAPEAAAYTGNAGSRQ
jgi:hypothetical protein